MLAHAVWPFTNRNLTNNKPARAIIKTHPKFGSECNLTADQWNSGVGQHNVSSRSAGDHRLRFATSQNAMTMSAFSGMAKTTQATSTQT